MGSAAGASAPRGREGMTLVELLVVLVILASLAASVAVSTSGTVDRAKRDRTVRQGEAMRDEWGDYTSVYGSHQDYAVHYLKKMIEADEDCADVLTQLSATRSAISGLGKEIMNEHIAHCISHAMEDGDLAAVEEFQKAIERFF